MCRRWVFVAMILRAIGLVAGGPAAPLSGGRRGPTEVR